LLHGGILRTVTRTTLSVVNGFDAVPLVKTFLIRQ
jgi:hypothetical protein